MTCWYCWPEAAAAVAAASAARAVVDAVDLQQPAGGVEEVDLHCCTSCDLVAAVAVEDGADGEGEGVDDLAYGVVVDGDGGCSSEAPDRGPVDFLARPRSRSLRRRPLVTYRKRKRPESGGRSVGRRHPCGPCCWENRVGNLRPYRPAGHRSTPRF